MKASLRRRRRIWGRKVSGENASTRSFSRMRLTEADPKGQIRQLDVQGWAASCWRAWRDDHGGLPRSEVATHNRLGPNVFYVTAMKMSLMITLMAPAG